MKREEASTCTLPPSPGAHPRHTRQEVMEHSTPYSQNLSPLADSHGLAWLSHWGRAGLWAVRLVVSSVAGRSPWLLFSRAKMSGRQRSYSLTFWHVRREARGASTLAIGSAVCFGAALSHSLCPAIRLVRPPSDGLQRSGLGQCGKLCFPAKRGFVKALHLSSLPRVSQPFASWGGLRKQVSLTQCLPS